MCAGVAWIPDVLQESPAATGDGIECVGVLDGARFPEIIPDYVAWHQLWKGVGTPQAGAQGKEGVKSAIGLADGGFEALTSIASERAADAQAIDESINAGRRMPDLARRTVQARDQAVRDLSASDFERTQEWVETQRRSIKYRLWKKSLASRAAAVRSLSNDSWAAVERHIDRLRYGTLFDFPTGF